MNFQPLLDYILGRLGEKSTWVVLAGLVMAALGHAVTPDLAPQVDAIATALASVAVVVLKEKGSPK